MHSGRSCALRLPSPVPAPWASDFLSHISAKSASWREKNKIKCINHLCHALKLNTHSSAINRSAAAAAPCWGHVLQQELQTQRLQAGLPPGCADNDSQFSTGWSHLRVRRLLGNCYNLFHISCGCCLPHTHTLYAAETTSECVCKFTSLWFSPKTTNEFRPAWQKLIRIFELLLKRNEAKPK